MKIFAIGDLHLSFSNPKPMDIFGTKWGEHEKLVQTSWNELVGNDDIVLIPGDISWAMQFAQAKVDLDFVGALPGKKIIIKGNHDYWWSSISKLREMLPEKMFALQNDFMRFDNVIICGSRGWVCPGSNNFTPNDQKIYDREVIRMGLSLGKIKKNAGDILVAMTHYPPFDEKQNFSEFTNLYALHEVDFAIYGHLHGRSCKNAFEGKLANVHYSLTSCDHLNFSPKLIFET